MSVPIYPSFPQPSSLVTISLFSLSVIKYGMLHEFVCHSCTGAMLISAWFQAPKSLDRNSKTKTAGWSPGMSINCAGDAVSRWNTIPKASWWRGVNNWREAPWVTGAGDGGKALDEAGKPGMVLDIQGLRDCEKMLVFILRSMRNK